MKIINNLLPIIGIIGAVSAVFALEHALILVGILAFFFAACSIAVCQIMSSWCHQQAVLAEREQGAHAETGRHYNTIGVDVSI